MIQRHQIIANLCQLLQTEYVSLLGQRRVGKRVLINQLLNNKKTFFGMKFISVGLPQNVHKSDSFMEIFFQRLLDASTQVPPREEICKQLSQLTESEKSYPSDIRLRSLLGLLGSKTSSNYLVIILQDLAEVSEEPLKELLLLLREYHNQRNNPGEAGAKLRFLVTGGFRLWNLSFNKISSISPFNISKRLFIDGCTYEDLQNHYSTYNIKKVAQLHDLTNGIPSLIEQAANSFQDSEDLSIYFAPIQDNWNTLSGYTKELLNKLANNKEDFLNCRPDYDCLQIPNFEFNHSDWTSAFWAGFLKMRYGELIWRSPIHQAFVMSYNDLSANISKSILLESNLSSRLAKLESAIKKINNLDVFNEILEELIGLVVQLDKAELIQILEMLRNQEENLCVLEKLKDLSSCSKYKRISEFFRQSNFAIKSEDYQVTLELILLEIKESTQMPQEDITNDNSFNRMDYLVDFMIITAIKAERLAVLNAFGIDEIKDRVRKGSRTYWCKQVFLNDSRFYKIVVAQSIDIANVNAAILTNDTLHHWQPAAVLMTGISATAKPESKQKLGDLVVGKEVYYYETSKITAEGKLPEPKQIPVDATLLDRVNALPDSDFSILAERPDGTNTRPKVEPGVIASGDKVIADAAERDAIAAANRKIMAIEMEGYGVISAAWQSFEQVRCLVIRSLCDYADSSKNDQWHAYAAAVAAGFTKHFLLDEPLEPRNLS